MRDLRWTIGEVTVTRVEESCVANLAADVFTGTSPEGLARHLEWLGPFVKPDGRLIFSMHALLIESHGERIVVDTCVGHRAPAAFASMIVPDWTFLQRLEDAGFGRGSVDHVICTHLHFDHIGWNTLVEDGVRVPTFAGARYVVTRREREAFARAVAGTSGELGAYGLAESVLPLEEAGVLHLVEPGHNVTEAVWLEAAPGHSPGQVMVHIDSGGQHALITADVTHHPVQWAEPDWCAHADSDQAVSADTRRRVAAEHADTRTLVIGTHYPPPTAGHIVSVADGYRFVRHQGQGVLDVHQPVAASER